MGSGTGQWWRRVHQQERQDCAEIQKLQHWWLHKLKEKQEQEVETKAREEERLKEETQRRAIQDALNKQTFQQFKGYAEQQYPGRIKGTPS